jgi:hypothetical protein
MLVKVIFYDRGSSIQDSQIYGNANKAKQIIDNEIFMTRKMTIQKLS